MKPRIYRDKRRFVQDIQAALSCESIGLPIPFKLTPMDSSDSYIMIFQNGRKQSVCGPIDDVGWNETIDRINLASDFVSTNVSGKNNNLGTGSQSAPTHVITELAQRINVSQGDTYWDIGCGTPRMAFSLSAASNGGVVVATDTNKIYNDITFALDEYVTRQNLHIALSDTVELVSTYKMIYHDEVTIL